MSPTITVPETEAELAELLNDGKRLVPLIKDGQFADLIKAYTAKMMDGRSGELGRQLSEGLQAGLAEWLKANNAVAPHPAQLSAAAQTQISQSSGALRRTSAQRALYSRNAPGAGADGIFADGAEFFRALHAQRSGRMPEGMADKIGRLQTIQNSFGSEVPSSGGFLIPEVLRSQIMEVALEEGLIRQRATVIPMSSLRVPIPMVDDTSHVNSILGGVICYWAEEAAPLTESQASFGVVTLDAKKLTGYATIPNELLDDAPAFQGFFDSIFPRAIAWFEDLAFLAGTGTGQPLGLINCPASVQVAVESGQPTQTIVWENITKMYARMLPTSLSRGIWIASIDTFPQLATMALSVGTGGGPVWIGNFAGGNGGADTPPVSILGRPVYFTEKTGPLGTTGDISFVDPSYYLIGDRQQMQTMESPHYLFANDKTAFRAIERVDGRPWLQSPLTPHNGSSNTLSPFVQLASR